MILPRNYKNSSQNYAKIYQNTEISNGSYQLVMNQLNQTIALSFVDMHPILTIAITSHKNVFLNISFTTDFTNSLISPDLTIGSVVFSINSSNFLSWYVSTTIISGILSSTTKFVFINSTEMFNVPTEHLSDFVEMRTFMGNGTYFILGERYQEDPNKVFEWVLIILLGNIVWILPVLFIGYLLLEKKRKK